MAWLLLQCESIPSHGSSSGTSTLDLPFLWRMKVELPEGFAPGSSVAMYNHVSFVKYMCYYCWLYS